MGEIKPWNPASSPLLAMLLLLLASPTSAPSPLLAMLLLLLASPTAAEFLTPLPDHADVLLPDLCHKATVMSCT